VAAGAARGARQARLTLCMLHITRGGPAARNPPANRRGDVNELLILPWLPVAAVVLLILIVVLLVALLLRRAPDPGAVVLPELATLGAAQAQQQRELRGEFATQSRDNRAELGAILNELARSLVQQTSSIAQVQNGQIDSFARQLTTLTESNEHRLGALRETSIADAQRNREEAAKNLKDFSSSVQLALTELGQRNDRRMQEVRETLETKLRELQTDNAAKLEEMRRTVDEKLHATLEQRLGQSFQLVSERLEQVHKGLGEMQALASDVGDLKRVLTNVKSRGTWGEVQLGAILEQILVREQYELNVEVVAGSNERVEYAIRLPGRGDDTPVWLPIDAKFPREDYERLVRAQERADAPGAEAAGRQLEVRLRLEAKTIAQKYLAPPETTDFAVLFLPTEGLYAEVLRRPGLVDGLQHDSRVVVAGPTTLAAILSSLQMGFRTLAVEKRSSEVWQLLGAVKTEFGKFGDVLDNTRTHLERATNSIGSARVRTRAIERKLRDVQSLPESDSRRLLPEPEESGDEDESEES